MLNYQDYIREVGEPDNQDEGRKASFIAKAIQEYQNSELYLRAKMAQKYYERKNEAILKRLGFLERSGKVNKSQVIFHKICNGFFPKMCKQLSQYLLGNGISIDDKYKKKLGSKFDKDIQTMGINTLVDGVNWGFWNVNRLKHYRATEFFAIVDEWTNIPMVGIHFWETEQTNFSNKKTGENIRIMNIELFEIKGITPYIMSNNTVKIMPGKTTTPYKTKIFSDKLSTQIIGTEVYEVLPVFPLYANELQVSEFNDGLKSMIDAYDFINSDLADGITQVEGIYWAIKNYGGVDAAELLREISEYRATVDQQDSTIQNFNVEIPFNAKQYALELLEDNIYSDSMILNMKQIQGGSLTNVAINVAKTDFDLKTDIFEWQVADFVQNILSLLGFSEVEVKFKRRTITNDTETITNISTMIADGYVDEEWAINNNPLIADGDQEDLLDRILLGKTGVPLNDQAIDDDGITEDSSVSDDDVIEQAEQISNKTLNGAQTSALMSVISQYSAGTINIGQAVNIISVSIGISKEEAKKILEGTE